MVGGATRDEAEADYEVARLRRRADFDHLLSRLEAVQVELHAIGKTFSIMGLDRASDTCAEAHRLLEGAASEARRAERP